MNSVVYGVNVLLLGAFAFLLWRRSNVVLQNFFWPALAIKLIAGISLGLIYTYYYTANDTFLFFNDAKILAASARTDGYTYLRFLWGGDEDSPLWNQLRTVEPRSLFFVKTLSFISLISNDNYWIASLWFSFLSFLGCWYLFVRLNDFFKNAVWPAALSLFFFPSFVFWGSGIIKESITAAALCFIIGVFLLCIHKRKPTLAEWFLVMASFYAMWNLKYYWAAILIPTLATSLIMKYVVEKIIKLKSKIAEVAIWLLLFSTLCLGVSFVHPNFYLERLLPVITENHNIFVRISAPQGVIHFYQLEPNWYSMLLNAPWALFSGLFRPFVFESNSLLQLIVSIENAILLVFFVFSISKVQRITDSSFRLVIYSAIVYVVLLCIFLALSTPNFGTLSRYRIGFLPVFCFLLFYENPLWTRWPFGRK